MAKSAKVLILGETGMLGSMVVDYLSRNHELAVKGTNRTNFEIGKFLNQPDNFAWIKKFDYLINCTGIIKPYCKDNDPVGVERAIEANALFPHKLSDYLINTRLKIMQIATDCVYSGTTGRYRENAPHNPEDVYGQTKSLGEVFGNANFLNIRCSIIGPEIKGKLSLLEWFLSQPKGTTLTGFSHHKWNGVTTLQFAQLMEQIILKENFIALRSRHHTLHFLPNTTVNKAELLAIFIDVFHRPHRLEIKADIGPAIDRTLASDYPDLTQLLPPMEMQDAIRELAAYIKIKGNRWKG